MDIYYKILHKEKGLYLKGTPSYFSYDSSGRIFQTMGRLRSFLTGVLNSRRRNQNMSEWQIVEIEMVIKNKKEVIDIIDPKKIVEILSR